MHDNTYKNITKWWLSAILFLLPFQRRISKSIVFFGDGNLSHNISSFINSVDELTIIIFIFLTIREVYIRRELPDRMQLILLLPICFLCIEGVISGIVNGNAFITTILGVFDYVKNFLVIFIYAAFIKNVDEIKRIFRILLTIAVIIAGVAFIQELWALIGRYLIGIDFNQTVSYILLRFDKADVVWRSGLYRATSLVHNSNVMGLYCLLILTIYMHIVKRINFLIVVSLFTGIATSLSRMAITGLMFLAGIQIFKGRKWMMLIIIPCIVFLFSMRTIGHYDILETIFDSYVEEVEMIQPNSEEESSEEVSPLLYREYTKNKALEIWKDYPFLGAGPGMYGGIISLKTHSLFYELYNFTAKSLLIKWSGIDQFWPQLLAETGIVGIAGYAALLLTILVLLLMSRQRVFLSEIKGLFDGLSIFMFIIVIYSFGSGLNVTSIIFTYCALTGMGLGCVPKKQINGPYSITAPQTERIHH